MDCPNQDCKDMVLGHDVTLHGQDHMSGAIGEIKDQKGCLAKKVSRKGMVATIVLVVLSLIGSACIVTVYALDSLKEDRAVVAENRQKISNMDAKLEYLEVMVEENHNNLEAIKEQVEDQITPSQLRKLIIDAVKEGNEP